MFSASLIPLDLPDRDGTKLFLPPEFTPLPHAGTAPLMLQSGRSVEREVDSSGRCKLDMLQHHNVFLSGEPRRCGHRIPVNDQRLIGAACGFPARWRGGSCEPSADAAAGGDKWDAIQRGVPAVPSGRCGPTPKGKECSLTRISAFHDPSVRRLLTRAIRLLSRSDRPLPSSPLALQGDCLSV